MKVVLFCSGLGTRIRDYSESIHIPMILVGVQPTLSHIMAYYSHYGHREFILCLGYTSIVIKDDSLYFKSSTQGTFAISIFRKSVEVLGATPPEWRITLVDTVIWRNIGERLVAATHFFIDEEHFLAKDSDRLIGVPLPAMIERLQRSGKAGSFMAVRPPFNFHLTEFENEGAVSCPDPARKQINGYTAGTLSSTIGPSTIFGTARS